MENKQHEIIGILLAAGSASRFGGDKLLYPLEDGVALGAHAARNLVAAGLEVVAVVKSGDFPLYDMLEEEGCSVTFCRHAELGMGASLAHGVEAARNAGGWVIALGDMPSIRPDTIKLVAQALNDGAEIAAPAYRGERGHPVGFSALFRSELTALSGDSGARAVLERHQNKIRLIECDDPGVIFDIDRRDDLGRAV
ncbi:MAG: nucleotidyltransferase family protein [Burkholderiales bacterium]|nr:nucleotidyltransferase family protein [Burkholderiales bacterium]